MPISYKNKIYMGRSISWNQLLQNPNFSNTVVDTLTHVSFRVQQMASPYDSFLAPKLQEPGAVSAVFTIPVSGNCRIKHNGSVHDIDFCYFTSVKDHKYYIYFNFTSTNPSVVGGVVYNKAQLFDLTQMFGAGNEPATPEEFWSYFENKLYPYNTGESQLLFKISRKRKLYMGRNIEWNQLLNKSGFFTTRTINGVTFTNNGDGTVTANGTATANADFRVSATTYKILANHKCLIVGGVNENAMVLFSGDPTGVWLDKGSGVITNQTVDTTAYNFSIRVNSGTTVSNVIFKPQLFDLTQMFGAGNEPATPAEFWSYFDHKLYPYNTGETQPLFKISRKSQWGSTANKGDLINIEGKQYRVLKTNGNVAEVLAMYNATTSQKFDTKSSYTNTYANNALDVYCNQTFYGSLSTAMQNAIVSKTFRQDSWQWDGGSSAIANYVGTSDNWNYTMSLMSMAYGEPISRKCYVLSTQDIIDYLEVTTSMNATNTTLTGVNVWKMFWNQTTDPSNSESQWLRSAYADPDEDGAVVILESGGDLNYVYAGDPGPVRPAFQIDLSKINWTKQG